jgi:hypothetical protein
MSYYPTSKQVTQIYTLNANTVPNGGYTLTGNTNTNYSNITTASGSYLTVGGGRVGSLWTNTTATTSPNMTVGKVKITETDIEIDGMSLRDILKSLQDRLAILVPDPEKLKEFEALKQAYDHYKILEALCCPTKNADNK